jgi:predicted acyltransferase (DUF342 family)
MREERGQISGDLVVHEKVDLWGSVGGNCRVVTGGKLYVRGSIYGDLLVEYGGRVHIYGNVAGNLWLGSNTKVIHSGVIGGNVTNDGGRLFIEKASKILGKVKTNAGETTYEGTTPPAPPRNPDQD